MMTFHERLTEAVRRHGPLCVGIDPRWDSLPASVRKNREPAEAFEEFGIRILELVRPFAGIVKPQAAFFEQYGPAGFRAMQSILHQAKELGYFTILDAKRGDIASTATAYAEAAFGPVWNADSLTVNPYLGQDAVQPFLDFARKNHRGIFVLVRTSNAGAGLFQELPCEGRPLYRRVADEVVKWNANLGDVGAVVGATHPKELQELRSLMPGVWFLVPGYGAQGGTAADVRAAFDSQGLGAVVNSSRGVTFPFHPDDADWEAKVVAAAKKASEELRG